jgi:hypothetical protein
MEITFHADATAPITLTAMTLAEAFLAGSDRHVRKVDLAAFTQVRVTGRVVTTSASANTPRILAAFKTGAFDPAVANYSNIGASGAEVGFSLFTGAIFGDSGWVNLNASAIANDIFLCIKTIGGDGVANPVVGSIDVAFR